MREKKGGVETVLAIVVSIMTIVTTWTAFADTLKKTFWWLVSHFWETLLILAGALFVCVLAYLFFANTQLGRSAWESIKTKLKSFLNPWLLAILLFVLVLLTLAFIFYRYWTKPTIKTITGTVYYKRCEGASGLVPAANVIVSLSELPNLESPPTKADGVFVISSVPADFNVKKLTMRTGGKSYPDIAYGTTYEVIPPVCDPPTDVREISKPWSERPSSECLTEDENQLANRKVFVLDSNLPPEGKEAILTVARSGPEVEILNAFVLLPATESDPDLNLYRNDMEGLDQKEKHRWRFTLLKKDLRIKLEVCLGSADSSVQLSSKNLYTYYRLQ